MSENEFLDPCALGGLCCLLNGGVVVENVKESFVLNKAYQVGAKHGLHVAIGTLANFVECFTGNAVATENNGFSFMFYAERNGWLDGCVVCFANQDFCFAHAE